MREIKFKYWNGKEMKNADTIHSWNDMGGADTSKAWDGDIHDYFDLIQYTGLKDKNGKEIYEGDIVKYGSNHPNIEKSLGKVIFYRGSFKLDYGSNRVRIYDGIDWAEEEMEIIGNIHENSELLK